MMAKMKDTGVTTVVMFVGYPQFGPLMQSATKLDYFPEWFFTGSGYSDLGLVARIYPTEQSEHAFGLSFIYAWTEPDTPAPPAVPYATQIDPLNWYWGTEVGTVNARLTTPIAWWLLAGIQAAGPNLTPKTFTQGLFALPPRGGAGSGSADSSLVAYGKGPRLPYNEYALSGYDFAPYWWDTETTGPRTGSAPSARVSAGSSTAASATSRPRGPRSSSRGSTRTESIYHFETPPTPRLGYAGDCKGCPSTGGPGEPGTPSTRRSSSERAAPAPRPRPDRSTGPGSGYSPPVVGHVETQAEGPLDADAHRRTPAPRDRRSRPRRARLRGSELHVR